MLPVMLFPSYYLLLSTSGRVSDVGQPNYPSVPTDSLLDLAPGLVFQALSSGAFTACRVGSISQARTQTVVCYDPTKKNIIKIR